MRGDNFIIGMDVIDSNDIVIECFGRYWSKDMVDWSRTQPHLYGKQTDKSTPVDFNEQIGIYLLHQGHDVVYVGQAVDQSISKRIAQHTKDSVRGRWDKFSWFGFYQVSEKKGLLNKSKAKVSNVSLKKLADTMEAILIECFEPGLNKKVGNNWGDNEYFQTIGALRRHLPIEHAGGDADMRCGVNCQDAFALLLPSDYQFC